jgi:[ribosomal protein S18]-alanine N-acetyltransferase
VKVRPSIISDIPAIKSIETAARLAPWSEADYSDAQTDSSKSLLVIQDQEDILGFILAQYLPETHDYGTIEILNIAVLQSHRGKGIGKRLIQGVIDDSSFKKGMIRLEVRSSNTFARSFYEASGFLTDGIRKRYYTDPTDDAILMSRTFISS